MTAGTDTRHGRKSRLAWRDRWRITARLQLVTPLSLQSGEREPRAARGDDDREGTVARVARDVRDDPYIPGSSLKGVLRNWAARAFEHQHDLVIDVFGDRPQKKEPDDDEQQGKGGIAEFEDAFLLEGGVELVEVGSTAIDDATGTAAHRFLRSEERVPTGATFGITIGGDGLSEEHVRLLLCALDAFGDGEITLGGGTRTGLGRARADAVDVRRLTAAQVGRMLAARDPGQSQDWFGEDTIIEPDDLPALHGQAVSDADVWVTLTLVFDGGFLVAEPHPAPEPDRSKVRPIRAGYGEPFLPGTSVKGALRAQATRIANTIGGDRAALAAVNRLFGPEAAKDLSAGALTFSDFHMDDKTEPVTEEHVAIDRFTGGVAGGAKYAFEVQHGPTYRGSIGLRLRAPDHPPASGKAPGGNETEKLHVQRADLALLALLVRDLAEQDVLFGFGKTRGMGVVEGISAEVGARADIDDVVRRWLDDDHPRNVPTGEITDARRQFEAWADLVAAGQRELRGRQTDTADG